MKKGYLAVLVFWLGSQGGMQSQCAEIKIRAERRMGELLPEQIRKPGDTDKKIMLHDEILSAPPKLNDLGIDRAESHRYQQKESVPKEKYQQIPMLSTDSVDVLTVCRHCQYGFIGMVGDQL
jgi:hypothetical protein